MKYELNDRTYTIEYDERVNRHILWADGDQLDRSAITRDSNKVLIPYLGHKNFNLILDDQTKDFSRYTVVNP